MDPLKPRISCQYSIRLAKTERGGFDLETVIFWSLKNATSIADSDTSTSALYLVPFGYHLHKGWRLDSHLRVEDF